jgi:hypothetical protein
MRSSFDRERWLESRLQCEDRYRPGGSSLFEREGLRYRLGRGGRAVEGSGLENRQGCKPLEGSNPSLSATFEQGAQRLIGAARRLLRPGGGRRSVLRCLVDRFGVLLPLTGKSRYLARSGEVAEWLKALPC